MPIGDYATVNEFAPSWSDINTVLNIQGGISLKDIDYKGIKCNSTIAVGEQRGASGGRIIKRTTGAKTDTASATYYKSGMQRLLKALADVAPKDKQGRAQVSLVPFDVVVQFTPPGATEVYCVLIRGCRLIKMDLSHAEGNEADVVEIDLHPMEVVWMVDGKETVLI